MAADSQSIEKWIHPPLRGCLFLTGPTSSGKTLLALRLAEKLNAEIVSLDSMAIYRGMDIGTAKPSPEEQALAPHHLIDIRDPTEAYSVSNYVVDAHRIADEIRSRGKRVLICGGTPLFLKSLVKGLFLGPEADWEFREAVEADLAEHGEQALLQRLEQVDPLLAAKLHPNDHRRIIRALEVAKLTGRPLSHLQQQFENPAPNTDVAVAKLEIDRAWLHERINQRVEAMLDQGLIDETQGLLDKFGVLGRTASQAVGYKECIAHLEGKHSRDETRDLIQAHTRQFARRQEIWFRGVEECYKIEMDRNGSNDALVETIAEYFMSAMKKTEESSVEG